ncbi:MAG TPA: MerR family transcriptional regulator [Terriglobales bacterium]|nr:MerR family transcriptional regulator [Terriglobales bacterium]
MNQDILTLEDLARRTDLPEVTIAGWVKDKLLRPAGFADDRTPLFPVAAVDRIAQIRKLADLGYRPDEVQRIVKKIGLPQDCDGRMPAAEKDRFLTVGNLAERSGVSPRTIKHWEDKGIIEPDMRTEGGFRLYSGSYVLICQLIRDLQLFGYTLEEIKAISDDVRTLFAIQDDLKAFAKAEVEDKLESMLKAIQALFDKMGLLEEGIERWQDLLKKEKKDIQGLKARNQKRGPAAMGEEHA